MVGGGWWLVDWLVGWFGLVWFGLVWLVGWLVGLFVCLFFLPSFPPLKAPFVRTGHRIIYAENLH